MSNCDHKFVGSDYCLKCGWNPGKKTGASLARGQSKQNYGTPPEFIRAVENRFGKITFDLAASSENAVAPNFYTEEQNSLVQDWVSIAGLLWLNPPFGNIRPWAQKCSLESQRGAKIAFLTPASVGANWFRDYVHQQARVHFLNGRIQFVGTDHGFPKDCVLSVFGLDSGYEVWTWGNNV